MDSPVPTILERIVAQKRAGLPEARRAAADIERRAEAQAAGRRNFAAALRTGRPAIVAELKKASPSKGLLTPTYVPGKLARTYEQGGAAALSVLTDGPFFQGCLDDLAAARAAAGIPVLRKDFTIDPFHVMEAAAWGADAILLITAILSNAEMRQFRELAESYRMTALVEVHDESELRRAVDSGARVIGVNNRTLRTFEVSLEISLRLAELMPAETTRVAESGIRSAADIQTLTAAGYHAFLVGEHLVTSPDPAASIRDLAA